MIAPAPSTDKSLLSGDCSHLQRSTYYGSMKYVQVDETPSGEYWIPLKLPPESSTSKSSSRTDLTSASTDNMSEMFDEIFSEDSNLVDCFFSFLGFPQNPFASDSDIRNSKASDMRLSMLSNLSTAYNVVSISLALDMMQELYETTPNDKSLCSSALIAGMIVGQLAGGAIGDVLGRHMAMAVVMSLQIVGAVITACAFDGYFSIYGFIAFWRLVLGVGCGGVYPLAATITAESNHEKQDGGKAVAFIFSMQGIGYLVPPLLTAIITGFLPPDLCWRVVLGFGAVPGLWLMVLRLKNQMIQTTSLGNTRKHMILGSAREVPVNVLEAIAWEPDLLRKMLGTGGCWFLFDVLFYGNVLFQPIVLSAAFGKAETVRKAAFDTAIVSLLAVPGYFGSVIAMGRQSPRWIQAQGFFLMSVLYALIGIFFNDLARHKIALVLLYGGTFLFSNYGPNATVSIIELLISVVDLRGEFSPFCCFLVLKTYVLPSLTFSRTCRSTLNGICAACGKAGALIGSTMFVFAASRFGEEVVLMACSGVSLIGMVVTLCCVSENIPIDEQDSETAASRVPMRTVISEPSLVDYYDTV
jgi:MFS transporter, PHS family, inorganic phosphate transporter